jgi:uncharacterized repeat protein (TIGR01451 family)
MTCTATSPLTAADLTAGRVINTATATAAGPNGFDPPDASASTTVAVRPADYRLSIAKTGTAQSNGRIAWTIAVTNHGPDAAPGPILVEDTVPAALSVEQVTAPTGWTCATTGALIRCERAAALTAGATNQISIATTASGTNAVTNRATLVGPTGSNCQAGSSDPVCSTQASVTPTVDPNPAPAAPSPPSARPQAPLPQTGTNARRTILLATLLTIIGTAVLVGARRRIARTSQRT